MKTFFTIFFTALLTVGGIWLFKEFSTASSTAQNPKEPQTLYYQSAMHPWIKSDKPGRCTICGMELTPVHVGEKGLDPIDTANRIYLTHQQIRITGIQTTKAEVRPLLRTLQVAGMIDDDATRHRVISAYTDGRIEKLHINYLGAEVSQGHPLADFYSPALLQAEREYRQLGGDLRNATALRLRQMGLTTEQIVNLPTKAPEILHSEILSPLEGTVVAQKVYEGQYVTAGQKLFEIADFSIMWFQFIAYETDLPWIHPGQRVSIRTPSLPGKLLEGKISFIDPNFDEATRSTKVRVELPNPWVHGRRELLHKLYADGIVQMDAVEVLTIPKSAILQTGPNAVVYLDRGEGFYEQTLVKIGRKGDSLAEVLSGLKAEDSVVTQGNLLLDGQAELNHSFSPRLTSQDSSGQVLTHEQQIALRDFIDLSDILSADLAGDNLTAFNESAKLAIPRTSALVESLKEQGLPNEQLTALDHSKQLQGFTDLQAARAAFLRFSMNATALLAPLRNVPDFPAMKLWQCPMVNQAIPGSSAKGRWIQNETRPIANPYFGSQMPDCGEEIKP